MEFLQIKINTNILKGKTRKKCIEIDKISFGLGRLFLKTNIYIPRHTRRNKCLKLDKLFLILIFLDLNLVECSLGHDHHMKYHSYKIYLYLQYEV
jgi:hypothetical protein